jgi:hypothetical protein
VEGDPVVEDLDANEFGQQELDRPTLAAEHNAVIRHDQRSAVVRLEVEPVTTECPRDEPVLT